MSDLIERLSALEALVADLPLSSLPIGALQRRLENDWQPDANVLLQPNSISFDQLQVGIKPQGGTGTLAWPGGASTSTALVVNHSLGVIPRVVATPGSSGGLTQIPVLNVSAITATQFTVTAGTVDGQLPLAAASTPFNWIALG